MPPPTHQPLVDPEDMFADTRMSFGDHIEELRYHLFRAMFGFVAALIICLCPPFGPWALKFITAPVEYQLQEYYNRRAANIQTPDEEVMKRVPMVPMQIKIFMPALRDAMAGKKADDGQILESMILAIDKLQLDLGSGASRNDVDDPNWGRVPILLPDPVSLAKALQVTQNLIQPKRMTALSVQEVFVVYVKVGLLMGFIVASPWIFYQVWSFIAAGLYPHEKKLVNHYLPVSLALFLMGAAVCQFLALPKAIEALLWFNEWLGFDPDLRLSEWLSFAVAMPLVFGLSFQTPIVMLFLFKLGIADIETFRSKRKISIMAMGVIAAVITPSTDPTTMLILWIPMYILYEAGIWLCIMQPPSPIDEFDDSEMDEMVGV